jgi:hypothetical protein
MSQQFGTWRHGYDAPARIATSGMMLQEATAVAPGEPRYQPLIPFFPPSLVPGTGGAASGTSGTDDWKQLPGRLDLYCYQGDDVQIPLFFSDPTDWEIDMSTWEWKGQVRVIHNARSTLVHDFVTAAEYLPPEPSDEQPQGMTQVTLFLPHQFNVFTGRYCWDVCSTGPFDGPAYPVEPPAGIEIDEWPPTTSVKTWLYGEFWVVPRVTATEWVPPPDALPVGGDGGGVVVMTPAGWCVGPNGRVP